MVGMNVGFVTAGEMRISPGHVRYTTVAMKPADGRRGIVTERFMVTFVTLVEGPIQVGGISYNAMLACSWQTPIILPFTGTVGMPIGLLRRRAIARSRYVRLPGELLSLALLDCTRRIDRLRAIH